MPYSSIYFGHYLMENNFNYLGLHREEKCLTSVRYVLTELVSNISIRDITNWEFGTRKYS